MFSFLGLVNVDLHLPKLHLPCQGFIFLEVIDYQSDSRFLERANCVMVSLWRVARITL